MSDTPKIDAILCPVAKLQGGSVGDHAISAKALFREIFGLPVVVRHAAGNTALITHDPVANRYFPRDHPRDGQERYDWTDRGDGVMYGTLVEGAAGA
jgi:hypothetical protein